MFHFVWGHRCEVCMDVHTCVRVHTSLCITASVDVCLTFFLCEWVGVMGITFRGRRVSFFPFLVAIEDIWDYQAHPTPSFLAYLGYFQQNSVHFGHCWPHLV